MMGRPAGLEARRRLEAFQLAGREVLHAEALLCAALATSGTAPGNRAFSAGVDLARRRVARRVAQRDAALAALADGRPPYEAFWTLPDSL